MIEVLRLAPTQRPYAPFHRPKSLSKASGGERWVAEQRSSSGWKLGWQRVRLLGFLMIFAAKMLRFKAKNPILSFNVFLLFIETGGSKQKAFLLWNDLLWIVSIIFQLWDLAKQVERPSCFAPGAGALWVVLCSVDFQNVCLDEAPYDLFVVFSIKARNVHQRDLLWKIETCGAFLALEVETTSMFLPIPKKPGSRDYCLLRLLLHLCAGHWIWRATASIFGWIQPRVSNLRNYVSEEYGMSDTEAGNLYAAYGFACTGSAKFVCIVKHRLHRKV